MVEIGEYWKSRETLRSDRIDSITEEARKQNLFRWQDIRWLAMKMYPKLSFGTIYGDSKVIESILSNERTKSDPQK